MMEAQYTEEVSPAQLFLGFSILAIFIACLGLYGLAAYTAERRTKEIGIRKVMGASTKDIIQILAWQFSKPVLIANAIAWPVAFYVMQNWLQSFQYRLGNDFILVVLILASIFALILAWLTVASRAFKVARANPIKALRYE
jgi:putative ABC transport system permease protein